ncbi:YCII-related [Dickeya chrysanthemi Ech1591]|uniref:YCII-related n=1 Tax=Dickeya chrysanthemi (strain Ech1591) TaxID=561229 RepID=C6CMQ6_DICC1|nr:YciI family protein [Dickeya chrysanthemi]ACT05830.1 YCII-related [Dickeya chrysanthemi Ech1591]
MLHAITLEYAGTKHELEKYIDAHKKWLAENIKQGRVVFAGPLEDGTGGFILAYGTESAAVVEMLSDDPFVHQGLVRVEIKTIEPAICSGHFYAGWAGEAKSL